MQTINNQLLKCSFIPMSQRGTSGFIYIVDMMVMHKALVRSSYEMVFLFTGKSSTLLLVIFQL